MAGLLISFEGQDASGKSTITHLVTKRLTEAGIATILVSEFSSRVIGRFLQETLTRDKFLRLNSEGPSARTETMYVLSDLYSQDEMDIVPALRRGEIVIKERHIDSILACQIPKICDDYKHRPEQGVFEWLNSACAELTKPDLTMFLRVSEPVLRRRIAARGEHASDADLALFRRRQHIYDRLARQDPNRWRDVPNDGDVEVAVNVITTTIESHLASI